ncbi:MAG: type III pantothenate kinase [Bacteroidota bacterium]
MNLIIDLGNTAVKWALFEVKNLIVKGKSSYSDLDKEIQNWLSYPILNVAISAVVEVPSSLNNFLEKYDYVLKIDNKCSIPIKNSYKTPSSLGADRLVNAVAASYIADDGDVLVIDCGTCIKIDYTSKYKGFVGGSISPGVRMRYASLNHFTAKLPLLEPGEWTGLFGADTNDSIHHGVMNGVLYEINGAIENYQSQIPEIKIILTGGDLHFFQNLIEKKAIFAEPDLTLTGINLILLHNKNE